MDVLEGLLVAGEFARAAEASAKLLQQSKGSSDACHFHRLLFVALQSHFYSGRQEQLLEQLNRDHCGLLGLPTQVFLLWQLLQLEIGDASSAARCSSQVEAFLTELCSKAKEPGEQLHSDKACATAQDPSAYADTVALVRFYALDLLCNSLNRHASAAALVDSGPAGALLEAEDLECLRAEIASTRQGQLHAGQQHDHTQHPYSRACALSGSSSPFCTVLGELDDDVHGHEAVQPRSLSMHGHNGQPAHDQGMQNSSAYVASPGHSTHEGADSAAACQGQTLWPAAVHSKLWGVRAWAAQTARVTWAWGRGVAGLACSDRRQPATEGAHREEGPQGAGSSCDPTSVGRAGRAQAASSLHGGREKEGSRSSAADLAMAVAVAAMLYAAYRERKAISRAAQARARALRAAFSDLARMGLSLNPSSGFVPTR